MNEAAARKEQEDQLAKLHGQYDRVVENGRVHFQSKKEEPHQSIIREGRKIVIKGGGIRHHARSTSGGSHEDLLNNRSSSAASEDPEDWAAFTRT